MAKAIWKDQVLAESSQTIIVEGSRYFPPESVNREFLRESDHHAVCHWKGVASYFHVQIGAETNQNAAWYYPEPKDAARQIKDYVAFSRGVRVED